MKRGSTVQGFRLAAACAAVAGCALLYGCSNDVEGLIDRVSMNLTGAKPVKRYDYGKKYSSTPPGAYRNTYIPAPGQPVAPRYRTR